MNLKLTLCVCALAGVLAAVDTASIDVDVKTNTTGTSTAAEVKKRPAEVRIKGRKSAPGEDPNDVHKLVTPATPAVTVSPNATAAPLITTSKSVVGREGVIERTIGTNGTTTVANNTTLAVANTTVLHKVEEIPVKPTTNATTSTPSTSTTSTTTTTTTSTTTTTTTTTTPKPLKPKILQYSFEDQPEETQPEHKTVSRGKLPTVDEPEQPNVQFSQELSINDVATPHQDYFSLLVICVFAVPVMMGAGIVGYRKVRDYWSTRHYRRMDFLVDGMYND